MKKIRVLVVDDSALMRRLLTDIFKSDREIEVVGAAVDAFMARDLIKRLDPDVITLDVEMPKMDGITFLSNLMRLRPMPVVMISSLTERNADLTLMALEIGALDFVSKPKVDVSHNISRCSEEIISKVKVAARTTVTYSSKRVAPTRDSSSATASKTSASKNAPSSDTTGYKTTDRVIAIGSSTGGTEAVKDILMTLNPGCPGIVIAQHIPPVFSASFAKRLDTCTPLNVVEAQEGQQILTGHAFVAPGDHHLEVVRDGARYRCHITKADPVNRHRPSVDVLFDSVANTVGRNAIGVILTGMGKDGAKGLKRMMVSGATTFAQDEETSVVWGMPGSAVQEGGVGLVLPLPKMAASITSASLKMEV